jgi:hypothetical protein
MAYNQNIPQATDKLKDSQPDILANFQAIKTLVDINHVTFDDPSGDQGKHKWITFPVQVSAPSFGAGEEGLYNLPYNNTSNTVNETFVHKQTSSGTQDIPFTASILSQNSSPGNNTTGWSWLPSGILIRWESITGLPGGLSTITLSAGFPSFTQIFTVIVSPYNASTSDQNFAVRLVDILSGTQFRIYASSRTTTGAAAAGVAGAKFFIIGR